MNRLFFEKIRTYLLVGVWLLAASCAETEPERVRAFIEADTKMVLLNKLGWTPIGEQGQFEVNSNIYWKMTIEPASEWLAADVMGGFGKTEIKLTATPNEDAERHATLVLESYDGFCERIEVKQAVGDGVLDFFRVDLDAITAEMVPVNSFDYFELSGTGSYRARLAGENAYVDLEQPSSGYEGASGGSNLLLSESGAQVQVQQIDLKWQQDFQLSYGVMTDGAAFLPDEFGFSISRDGDNWLDVPVSRSENSNWEQVELKFHLQQKTQYLYLRWASLSTSASFRIDDVVLTENPNGDGVELDFDNLYDDNRPEGYVYFEEHFNWITGDFAQPKAAPLVDFIGIYREEGKIASTGPRYDRTGSDQGVYPWTITDFWQPAGWAHQTKNAIYLCLGYFQMGSGSGAADIVSPRLNKYTPANSAIPSRAGIPIGKRVNVKVSFDVSTFASASGDKDKTDFKVEVLDQGTIGSRDPKSKSAVIEVDSYNEWKNCSVIVYDASAETRLKFSVEGGARHHFDNVRIEKVYPIEE